MNPIRVLVLLHESSRTLNENALSAFQSSSDFTFQVESYSVKPDNDNHIFRLAGNFDPEAILLYVICVDESITAFPLLRARFPNRPFLTLFENDESDSIFKILELGVDDFLTSPVKPCELRLRFKRLLDRFHHEDQFELSIKKKFGLKQLVGESKEFISEIKKIPLLAKCDATVLITGETGTGKELCARAIHYLSSRCRGPFVPVNCGAIPVDLVENELFGHERGAFTGALVSTSGLIQEAERGTLFLDEIDCLPLYSQVKLLRFLQEKEYRPLGANKMKRADVRLLAAMNVDPQEAVASGKLRQDLFYRLNVLPLIIPPLRNRREDIPLLARNFLHKYAMEFDKDASDFSPEAMQLLVLYDWPGNVRELEHIIERAVVLSKHSFIEASDISLPSFGSNSKESFNDAKIKMIAAFEKNYIERLLVAHHGNISQAARAAQKNRRAFWELLRKHRIDAGSFKI